MTDTADSRTQARPRRMATRSAAVGPTGRAARRGARPAAIGLTLVLALSGLTGCGSDSADQAASGAPSTSAPVSAPATGGATGAPAAAACAQVSQVQAALDTLTGTNVLTEGTTVLRARFASLKAEVDVLLATAAVDFSAQTAAVRASLAVLTGVLEGMKDSPSLAEAAAIPGAMNQVRSSTQALVDAIRNAC